MQLATVIQLPTENLGSLLWSLFVTVGGVAGVLALVGVGRAIGRFDNRMDAAEKAIDDRPTSAEFKALGKSIDNVREDVREVRDILLTGRRP